MDTYMYVPQQLIRDQACSHTDVVVWCYVFIETYNSYKTRSMISPSQIAFQMEEFYSQNLVSDVAKSIRHLIDEGYLHGERHDNRHYIIFMDSFDMSKYQYYVKVKIEDMYRITERSNRPFATLRYYLILLSTININTKCAFWSNASLAAVLGNDPAVVSRYIYTLENMLLIYVYRGIGTTNTYGRFEDKEDIITVGEARNKDRKTLTDASNYKRRMTQMYNQVKAGRKYDPVLMEELYNYCSKFPDKFDLKEVVNG